MNSRSRSLTPLKSVKNRNQHQYQDQEIKAHNLANSWMQGRCNKFEQCERRHYQTSQILYKQNKMENKINKINNEQLNNKKILVKVEQTTLLSESEVVKLTQKENDCLSVAIKISYKNKKELNELKNALNKNKKDPYTTIEEKSNNQREILNELLHNTQIDNKNQNTVNIKQKRERIQREQNEKALIMKNKPKMTLIRETEEKQVQNQQLDQNQKSEDNKGLIQEIEDSSDDETNMTEYNQIQQQTNQLINDFNQSAQQENDQNQNLQPNCQTSQINMSKQLNEFNSYNSQNPLAPKDQQYLNILLEPSQPDHIQEANRLPTTQIPQTLMSPQQIQEKDKQKNDNKKKVIQYAMSQLEPEMQNDLKWSQNIKSSYNQCKQLRDGKNQISIHPTLEEPIKQSPTNSIEQQETIKQSKLKTLYDWKKIFKSRAYRNDSLQNFINQQNPKLD